MLRNKKNTFKFTCEDLEALVINHLRDVENINTDSGIQFHWGGGILPDNKNFPITAEINTAVATKPCIRQLHSNPHHPTREIKSPKKEK